MSQHDLQPLSKKRSLQIKLGRPRPARSSNDDVTASPSPANGRPSGGLRISLKRKPSVVEQQAIRPQLQTQSSDEEDQEDQKEEHHDLDSHGQRSSDEEDQEDEEEDEEVEGDEEGEDGQGDGNDQDGLTDGQAASTSSKPSGSAGPHRRPIKKLRSKGLYESLPKLIENLQRRDGYKFFCEPVNADEVPGYSETIKEPMDLGTMASKIERREYSHMDEFKADFLLVVRNAQTFNPAGTLYHNEAKRLEGWGTRAIIREGMAVNDNGRAGIKGDQLKREKHQMQKQELESNRVFTDDQITTALTDGTQQPPQGTSLSGSRRRQHNPAPRYSFNAGIEALMDAARLKPQARQRAALVLGLTSRSLTREGSTLSIDEDVASVKAEDHADEDAMDVDEDSDDDANERGGDAGESESGARDASIARDSRERSITADATGSRRIGSSQPGATPSTPSGYRQASPDALRKRLAAVTGTPLQSIPPSPLGGFPMSAGGGGGTKASKVKLKHRLGAPGTPKRLLTSKISSGSATPINAQMVAALAQTQTQAGPAIPTYTFDEDGSINPEDIEDLSSYLTLRCSSRPILMPSIESLFPVPFVPSSYSGKGNEKSKEKDNTKEKNRDKDLDKEEGANDEEEEEGEGGRNKGDKDPLSTLPPPRQGAPDPLYSAMAPEPEQYGSNWSHDIEALPPNLRNLPFHLPSASLPNSKRSATAADLPGKDVKRPCLPSHFVNPAYVEAMKNDRKPKKQKDKEREKEREMLEDWTYYRPNLSRLLETTDLGPFPTLLTQQAVAASSQEGKGVQLSTELLAEENVRAFIEMMAQKDSPNLTAGSIRGRFSTAIREKRKLDASEVAQMGRDSVEILGDMVYGGLQGQAYVRSIADFVQGAVTSPLLTDEVDDLLYHRDQVEEAHRKKEEERARLAAKEALASVSGDTEVKAVASRRGPFMWRDGTAEVSDGTPATTTMEEDPKPIPPPAEGSPEHAKEGEDHEDQGGTDTAGEEREFAPLDRWLAEWVEDQVIGPITGHSIDILHLVSCYLQTASSKQLDLEKIEQRLLDNKLQAHPLEGVAIVSSAPPTTSANPTQPMPAPTQASATIPFTQEFEWVQKEPKLLQLLDEARQDVDSLGSILQYIVQNA